MVRLFGIADQKDSVGHASDLNGFGKKEHRRRIDDHQLVLFPGDLEQLPNCVSNAVKSSVCRGTRDDDIKILETAYRLPNIVKGRIAHHRIRKTYVIAEIEERVLIRTPQISINKERLFAALGVSNRHVRGTGRLAFA
jgi:hypothetical protein